MLAYIHCNIYIAERGFGDKSICCSSVFKYMAMQAPPKSYLEGLYQNVNLGFPAMVDDYSEWSLVCSLYYLVTFSLFLALYIH